VTETEGRRRAGGLKVSGIWMAGKERKLRLNYKLDRRKKRRRSETIKRRP
jgi:hypothetical protein